MFNVIITVRPPQNHFIKHHTDWIHDGMLLAEAGDGATRNFALHN